MTTLPFIDGDDDDDNPDDGWFQGFGDDPDDMGFDPDAHAFSGAGGYGERGESGGYGRYGGQGGYGGFASYGGYRDTPESESARRNPSIASRVTAAKCPRCNSTLNRPLQWGRKFGCILGAVAGAAGGAAAGCLTAPRLPARSLHWVSLISSAVIGSISGGTTGCRSGASLGDLLDERVLPNHQCQDCAKRFCHPRR